MNKFNVKMTQRKIYASMSSSLIRSDSSYKGAVEHISDLQKLIAFDKDYADVYETNTRWEFLNNTWTDTGASIPYNENLRATELPLDTSFEGPRLGDSKRFACEDHVHKQIHDGTKVDVTDFENNVNELNDKIDAEQQRAIQVETTLTYNIHAEIERAKAAENSLEMKIEQETTRSIDAENTLSNAIDAETQRAEQAEQTLKTSIEAETLNRKIADIELADKLNTEEAARVEADNNNASTISAETTRAMAAEQALSKNIDDAKSELQLNIHNESTRATQAENELNSKISTIESKIPEQASSENQLADKAFVNSSVMNNAARYMTPDAEGNEQWTSLQTLRSGPWYNQGVVTTPTKNDYAIYINDDKSVWRAMFDGTQWNAQYKVNDTPFTQAQLSAINSNITAELVESIDAHLTDTSNPHNVTKTQVGLDNVMNERQYSPQNPPPYPVVSVANKTGAVVLTKNDVGLSNVDNTSDLNKPISNATQSALNNKTSVNVDNKIVTTLEFDSDPQAQIDDLKTNKADAAAVATLEQSKTQVNVGGNIVKELSFTSDPQSQLDEINQSVDTKVDKVDGKGLSTNDYTDTDKSKLDGLANIKSIGDNLTLDGQGKLSATVQETVVDNQTIAKNAQGELYVKEFAYNGIIMTPSELVQANTITFLEDGE